MPSLETIKLIAALVGAALIAIASAVITHKVDAGKLATIEAGYAKAQAAASEQARLIQAAEDKVSLDAAVAEAKSQQQIVTVTNTIVREIPSHVPTSSNCSVTVGFVRVLNAAVLGIGAADLSYAPGKPDDACADVDPRSLAVNIVGNYAAALSNAEQLTALQDWVRRTIAASKPAK